MFTTINFRYLRISKTSVLPLNLLLSKEDLDWFNDYTFQEILSVLKPLLLSRVELYNQGHIAKRSIAPTTYSGVNQDLDDGLEDAGVILGGSGQDADHSSSSGNTTGKRRRGTGKGSEKAADRPQYVIRFGMRPSTSSEHGGAVLIADKKLGFSMVKKEQMDEKILQEEGTTSQRIQMGLARLEGEEGAIASGDVGDGIVVREEDESDSLRVSDFQRGDDEGDEDQQDDHGDEDYEGHGGSKGRRTPKGTNRNNRSKRAKVNESDVPSSQMDRKPTLQVHYSGLVLHPQTLYIVVRSLGSSAASTGSTSVLPFKPIAASSSSSSMAENSGDADRGTNNSGPMDRVSTQQDDEDSLFPPGMDYFAA
ncbi:hypothetical protein BC939DRAFT_461121 [Gamsiella multidivaricata]|uniref:uncharacterized protein n=1 Tax=Gamsiella multidivaricata TaxID=101098 RepID=UPI00221FB45C|nr:uncharacterized protein BC939DRAFT_461121 [Gamsiella multidivaricata]KAG0367990.1 hypothetical protein BGZ54_002888 [Gamsiella multidivaricata]KAI7819086.1 hypothetical protein BC939DRAFT_461121 [Gamsiella multidivaricata]